MAKRKGKLLRVYMSFCTRQCQVFLVLICTTDSLAHINRDQSSLLQKVNKLKIQSTCLILLCPFPIFLSSSSSFYFYSHENSLPCFSISANYCDAFSYSIFKLQKNPRNHPNKHRTKIQHKVRFKIFMAYFCTSSYNIKKRRY